MTTKRRDISLYRDEIIDEISPMSKNTVDHDVEFARRVLAVMGSKVIPALDKQDIRIEELERAVTRLLRSFPTDSDMQEARWGLLEIEEACNAHDEARALLTKKD